MSNYIDRSIYLDPAWDPYAHANALLAGTNDRDDPAVDFLPAANKLGYDLEEIDGDARRTLEAGWEGLLAQTTVAAESATDLAALSAAIAGLERSYERVAAKAVHSYDAALPLHTAVGNMADTAALARAAARYLQLCARLADAAGGLPATTRTLLELEACLGEEPRLRQVRACVAQMHAVEAKRLAALRDAAARMRGFDRLEDAVRCVAALDGPKALARMVTETVADALDEAGSDLAGAIEVAANFRRLQSQDPSAASRDYLARIGGVLAGLREQGDGLAELERALLRHASTGQGREGSAGSGGDAFVRMLLDDHFDGASNLRSYFWRELAGKIAGLTRDAARRDAWVYKTLRGADLDAVVSRGLKRGTLEYNVVFNSLRR